MYRIPGIIVTARGTVLAYAEARKRSGADWDTIQLMLRRSTDGGRTFSEQRSVAEVPDVPRSPVALERHQDRPDDQTYNNPVAITDFHGPVHFLFCREYMRVYYMRSDDDGQSFSKPRDITDALEPLRAKYPFRVVATGPGHGIQLRNGRLLVPIWLSPGLTGNGHGPSQTATLASNDGGMTWQAGDIAVADTPETPSPNETTAAELEDGRVMLNVRTPSPRNRRLIVVSKDGLNGWSNPAFDDDLPDPICFASLFRLSFKRSGGKSRLLFANPANLTRADGKPEIWKDRKNLTVRVSYNDGQTWAAERAIEPGSSGYADLAALPDGSVLCLYEAGGTFPNECVLLAHFDMAWLTNGKDRFLMKVPKRARYNRTMD